MANPPPPYDDITGISRAVMKDNAQETISAYNGVARPSELVVNQLTQDIYVGNVNGNLNLVAYGSGVTSTTTFNPQFTDGSGTFAGGTATASPFTTFGTAPTTLVTLFVPSSTYLTSAAWGTPTIAAAVA